MAKVDGGWKVVRANAGRATRNFDTQREAIEYARNISRKGNAELVIHGADGRTITRETYVNDPKPPRSRPRL